MTCRNISALWRIYDEGKRAEVSLRESEAQFRQLAESMPQIVWITRADGYHEYFNRRWYEFTGTVPGETNGELWSKLLHPDDYRPTMETWHHSLRTGEPYTIEYRFKRVGDGTYHWFLGRAMPIRNEQGEISRWFGTCTYIQEQKEAQQELARSNNELAAVRLCGFARPAGTAALNYQLS